MPVMDTYAPGTFCWIDLGTPDVAASKRFYTTLFGWEAEDRSMGPDAAYTVLMLKGRTIAALYPQEAASTGGAPQWLSYISVASANDAARRATALGGTALMDPFDVLDVGRMALVQDTTGAVLALWEARRHTGAGIIGETNAMCWNELATTDPRRAEAFYTGLFGWGSGARTAGDASYTTFMQDGAPRGGLLAIDASCGPVPPHWLVYFAVRDCDGQTALVQSLGGSVRVPPSGVPDVGRFAVVADPQGAAFAVIERSPASRRGSG
jgi:predicted enzyme related to lactoylglutathione lyase